VAVPALALNGVAVAVMVDSVQREEVEIGEGLTRAYDGSNLRTTQAYKRQWKARTTFLSQAESTALIALLQGRGDHWNFDADKYSDKGMVATADTNTTITATTPKYGAGSLSIAALNTNGITFPTGLGTSYCVMVWRLESGTWFWYWINVTNGTVALYKNGVSTATSLPAWITVSSGSLRLVGVTGTVFQYDDLVVLPFAVPLAWQAQLYAFAQTQAFPLAPALQISGDITPASFVGQGKPSAVSHRVGNIGSGFTDQLEQFDFDLWES
jgi:hypothetical protein